MTFHYFIIFLFSSILVASEPETQPLVENELLEKLNDLMNRGTLPNQDLIIDWLDESATINKKLIAIREGKIKDYTTTSPVFYDIESHYDTIFGNVEIFSFDNTMNAIEAHSKFDHANLDERYHRFKISLNNMYLSTQKYLKIYDSLIAQITEFYQRTDKSGDLEKLHLFNGDIQDFSQSLINENPLQECDAQTLLTYFNRLIRKRLDFTKKTKDLIEDLTQEQSDLQSLPASKLEKTLQETSEKNQAEHEVGAFLISYKKKKKTKKKKNQTSPITTLEYSSSSKSLEKTIETLRKDLLASDVEKKELLKEKKNLQKALTQVTGFVDTLKRKIAKQRQKQEKSSETERELLKENEDLHQKLDQAKASLEASKSHNKKMAKKERKYKEKESVLLEQNILLKSKIDHTQTFLETLQKENEQLHQKILTLEKKLAIFAKEKHELALKVNLGIQHRDNALDQAIMNSSTRFSTIAQLYAQLQQKESTINTLQNLVEALTHDNNYLSYSQLQENNRANAWRRKALQCVDEISREQQKKEGYNS